MNCIVIDDDKLLCKITEQFIGKIDFLNHLGSYTTALDAMSLLNENHEVHLIFLDIEMPEMTGIEFLKNLTDLPQIIIISSKDKYAIDAFEYNVTDYLLKPFSYARFYKSAQRAYKLYTKVKNNDGIFIKNNATSFVRLNYDDILWIEALENYVVVYNYSEKFVIHYTMKAMENKLPNSIFTRVHRSYIVNVKKINMIEDNNIILKYKGGTKLIPIAKTYRERLMTYINLVSK